MTSTNPWVRWAALLAGLAVVFGAFGAHALRDRVPASDLEIWRTGAFYHLVHAIAMMALALHARAPRITLILWTLGIIVFSGSLYTLVLSGTRVWGAITPLGGLCLIAGWLRLAWPAKSPDHPDESRS